MSLTGMIIAKTVFLVVTVLCLNFHILYADASEGGTFYGNIEPGLSIGNESTVNNHSSSYQTTWSLKYSVNSLIEPEVDSPFLPIDPLYAVSGFGFGDTGLSAELVILAEGAHLPGIVAETSALVPIDYSNEGAVSQIHELEHVLGLRKHLPFMSLQASIGYITLNDQISEQRFEHNFTYGLEMEMPLFIEEIIYSLELSGDLNTPDDEYPAIIRTSAGYAPISGIAIEWGLELGINDPEITNVILGLNFSI